MPKIVTLSVFAGALCLTACANTPVSTTSTVAAAAPSVTSLTLSPAEAEAVNAALPPGATPVVADAPIPIATAERVFEQIKAINNSTPAEKALQATIATETPIAQKAKQDFLQAQRIVTAADDAVSASPTGKALSVLLQAYKAAGSKNGS